MLTTRSPKTIGRSALATPAGSRDGPWPTAGSVSCSVG